MRDQEIIGLWEAYSSIYTPQQELTEEVQIAAQYFYEMGLNEDGVDILIEELGVEEFAEFVYDIAEEYVLTEARAGGAKIEVKTAKGKEIQGKPTAASLKRLRAQKAARSESEEKASTEKPSGMKASLQRQSAVAAAAKKQPKKPGFLDRVVGAVDAGIKRHNAAMSAAKETGKTISNVAKKVGGVAREVGKGASGTARLVGHVARKGLNDEYIMEYLIDEGYADTQEAAEAIMVNMSEEWRDDIVEKTAMAKRGHDETAIRNKIAKSTGGGEAADRATALENRPTYNPKKDQQRQNYARAQRGAHRTTTSSSPGLRGYGYQSSDPAVKALQAARGMQRGTATLTPNEKKQLNR